MKKLILVLMVLILAGTAQSEDLGLVNPGFEDAIEFNGWTTWASPQSSFDINETEFHSGLKSAEFSAKLDNWNRCAGAYQEFDVDGSPISVGSMVRLKGWGKATGDSPVTVLKIIYMHANNFELSSDEIRLADGAPIDWTYGEVTGLVPAECAKVKFEVAHFKKGCSFFDDIEAEVIGIEQTLSVSSTSGGSATTPGEGDFQYEQGTDANIVATADLHYHFVDWTGMGVTAGKVADPNSATTTITMDANYAVMANFAIDQMTIFGYVTEPDANIPVEGVFVYANNGGNSDTTDANGYYQLTVDYGWSGTVDPNKTGYTFEPNSIEYNNVTTDQNDNYTAMLDTFIIYGYAVDSEMLTPLEGVLMSPDNDGGPYTSKYYGGSDTTDANGYYEVLVDYNFSGKVVPSKYAYVFEPNSITYTDVTEDKEEIQDYVGTLLTYTITGCIKNSCEVPISKVLVDANNGGGSDITDANGFYEVWVDYNWSGTVTPSKTHYTFDPNSNAYACVLDDVIDQNYTATNIYDLDCDGSIGFGDVMIISENWLDGPDLPGDFCKDEDDIINFLDFADFANVWGD